MYKYTILFSLLTLPLAALSVLFGGGGHGSYFPLLLFFPFGLIGTLFNEEIFFLFVILGLVQLPIYGLLLDRCPVRKGVPVILGLHIICMFIIFILKRNTYF
ncbi:MAG TPA: hypothetical protein DEB71_07460 [Chryseobacterium carnipullorum]|nr:hypothetical protein [Chryseobacterium carnipullorum]